MCVQDDTTLAMSSSVTSWRKSRGPHAAFSQGIRDCPPQVVWQKVRIPLNVTDEPFQLRVVSHNVVEAFLLPELSRRSQGFIDAVSGHRFPCLHNGGQTVLAQRGNQDVDVVGHDHKVAKQIIFVLVMLQRAFDGFAQIRARQNTFSVRLVQPRLPTIWEALVIFCRGFVVPRFGVSFQPGLALGQPRVNPVFGQ
jgi:hypothetical protein